MADARRLLARGVFLVILAVAQIFAPVLASPALADTASTEASLLRAERAYATLAYDEALQIAAGLAKGGHLSHDHLVRIYRVLTLSNGALGNESAARDAAVTLLMFSPAFELNKDSSPKVRAPVMEAKLYWKDQPVHPGIDPAAIVSSTSEGQIRVELRDPTRVCNTVVIAYRWGLVGAFTERTFPAAHASGVPVPPPPVDATQLEYFAYALDENKNVVFERGTSERPLSTLVAPAPLGANMSEQKSKSVFASPWLWVAAAAVIGSGVASGVYFGTRKTDVTTEIQTAPARSAYLFGGISCDRASCN
jgi:hypothetical protein